MDSSLSPDDLDAALKEGIIDAETLDRLRRFSRERTGVLAAAHEESFRLLTGFNDIFVTIGIVLFLGALAYLTGNAANWYSAASVAIASWLLAEIFTRRRRMALPSIALLIAFTGAVYVMVFRLWTADAGMTAAGLAAVAAAALHWQRFRVPITIAAGYVAFSGAVLAAVSYFSDGIVTRHPEFVILPLGLGAFALAMRYDISDRERRTPRTDIAFWLHLIAAPAIVHPVVSRIADNGGIYAVNSIGIIILFCILSFVALVIDRRAPMVSSLAYLVYAMAALISSSIWNSSAYAVAVLAVGAIVLLLSVAWQPMRNAILRAMPEAVVRAVPAANRSR